MKIRYTLHAKLRMQQRGVTHEQVIQNLLYPDKFYYKNDQQTYITYYTSTKLLLIICKKIKGRYKIITVYYSDQLKKYLNL